MKVSFSFDRMETLDIIKDRVEWLLSARVDMKCLVLETMNAEGVIVSAELEEVDE